jgi:hypothetical protein
MRELERLRAWAGELLRGGPGQGDPPQSLVRAHHLAPLAYARGHAAFRDEYAAAAVMVTRRTGQLEEVGGLLAGEGVRAALIKGAAWAVELYPSPAERPMVDVDLLIEPSGVTRALDVLQGAGFEWVGALGRSAGTHAATLRRGEQMVDVHRELFQPGRSQVQLGEVWERTTPSHVPGLARLEPVDDALSCLMHIARHELVVPLLSYLDASLLLRRLSPHERLELERRARRYEVARAAAVVQAMLDALAQEASALSAGVLGPAMRALLPTPDQVLALRHSARARTIAQKLVLTQGPKELVGFAAGWIGSRTQASLRRLRRGVLA